MFSPSFHVSGYNDLAASDGYHQPLEVPDPKVGPCGA